MSQRGATKFFAIEKHLSEKLKELSRREGVTLFMSLLAGLQVMLSKYTGQQDIAVGTVVANRNRVEVEELIGFFVNTLVLRTEVGGNPSLKEVLRRVREVTLGAYQNQDVPFEKLVEELQPERDLSRSPLFQVMLMLQNNEEQELELPGVRLSRVDIQPSVAKFDLQLALNESVEGMTGEICYAVDLHEAETVERLVEHLRMVLEQMVEEPEQRIGDVSLLSGEEREQVVVEWNRTEVEYPQSCVHELFEEQVKRTPEAVAVEYEGRQMSYGELNRCANQLGHYLRKQGVGPEVRVGICMERSLEMVVGLLGIMKAGGAYVPLEPAHPVERLKYMLEDAQATVLLTREEMLDRLPEFAGIVVDLDAQEEEMSRQSSENPIPICAAENLMYVVYTSGSTGKPKGVGGTHRSMVNRLAWMERLFPVAEDERCCQKTSLGFIDAATEIFGPLVHGASLLIIGDSVVRDAKQLVELLAEHGITRMVLVPSLLRALLASEADPGRRLESLRMVVSSGEALGKDLAHLFRETMPQAHLLNFYGSSEVAGDATWYEASGCGASDRVLIGQPMDNVETYVLNEELEPVPVGMTGELYIGGAGLARGYLNRADLTAEKFVPNCFSRAAGERLYRTGDHARWQANGRLEFLGRRDHQVKIRGYRIELGEIEAVLLGHEDLEQAVVVIDAEQRLVGYVVRKTGAEKLQTSQLRSYLKERLPEYMVPSAFVMLEALPLTSSGKVDRKALPKPEYATSEDLTGACTPEEEILCGIFAEVLRLDRVGMKQNFFEAGGHSLLATRVISRIRNTFNVELPLRALFEAPTVAGLAERVSGLRGAGQLAAPPLAAVGREGDLPLSFAQQRLWFLHQLDPESVAYNMPFGIRLSGELNRQVLSKSLNELVRRHEVLRTHFVLKDGGAVQVIASAVEVKIEETDLRGMAEAEREGEVARYAEAEAHSGFDLGEGPLLRVKLLQLEEEHVLLATMHHIVSDGWSLGIMAREIGQLYGAYVKGEESPLAELPVQYGDYAVWQREWLRGEVLEEQLKYWRKQLGEMEPLDLPTDHPRPAVMNQRGVARTFTIGKQLSEKLKELSRGEGVTLFMVLLAGLQVVLSKYTGQEDIAVGTVVANRNRVEVEGLIGFFVNTLVLRTEVGGNPSLKEVLRRVREVTLGAYQNQDVPFEKLVEELQPERDLSRSPLFQVMLVLQNNEEQELKMPGVRLSRVGVQPSVTKFDLQLTLNESRGEGLAGEISYAVDLYEAGTVERMVEHWRMVLEEMVGEGERRMGDLSLLRGAEREQVLVEWNRTDVEYRQRCVHEMFEEQAERRPEAVAVEYEGRQLSYGELNRRANQLGHYLRKQGVGPEVRVGICVERSLEMVVGLLGILKAGGAYVPLDPEYPSERLAFMLEDSGVPVLLSQSHLLNRLPAVWGQIVCLDSEWEQIAEQSTANLEIPLEAGNAAYVIYTSGSSGRPKGVLNTHGGLSNLAAEQRRLFGVSRESGVLQFASLSFDAATWEWAMALTGGARLVLVKREELLDPEGLVRLLEEQEISVVTLPPSVLGVLPEAELRKLRTIVVAGEACWTELVSKWGEGRRMLNAYGPSETTVCVTVSEPLVKTGKPDIGKPIGNTQVYVLDENLAPTPVGVSGELYLGGAGLARGYVNRADLTAEKFVPNCFSRVEGERLYRTGDRGRWRSDGTLEFMGRLDDQVKVRGYRIELGEIEAALRECAGVEQAVVVVREDHRGDKRLMAYVVKHDEPGSSADLREYLHKRLPEYMVPGIIVQLGEMPLTPNGKVDRKALPSPDLENGMGAEQIAPRSAEEEILSGIFAEVLKLDRVGVEQNFFEAGGHSLLAMQVISRVRSAFNMELPLRALFEAPTVAGLAERVRSLRGTGQMAAPPIIRVSREGDLPLSFAQQRLWFLHQLEPESVVYSVPVGIRLRGELNRQVLIQSLNEMMRRHEVLRTHFVFKDGRPVQVIAGEVELKIKEIDLRGMAEVEHEAEALRLWREEVARPFDLGCGPLLRASLLQLAEQEYLLLAIMHHIVSDGWSTGIMIKELSQLYQAYVKGEESPLAELPVQYGDYAVWQREWLQGEVLEEQLKYWRKQLAEMEPLDLPTDHPRPAVMNQRGVARTFTIGKQLSEQLRELSQREGVTLFMVLLAGLQVVLSKYAGQQDIAVGTVVANRNRVEVEGLIGFFVNTLVLRTEVGGNPSLKEVLRRVREVTLGAYQNQDVPFEKLVEELQPERDLSRSPLFQVMLVLQNNEQEELHLPGVGLSGFAIKSNVAKFDMQLTLNEGRGEGLAGEIAYAVDLYEAGTVERMVEHWRMVLEEMVGEGERRMGDLSLLRGAEREQVLVEWNRTDVEYPQRSVHEMFEEQAERRPEAVAVEYEGRKLSYGELNRTGEPAGTLFKEAGSGAGGAGRDLRGAEPGDGGGTAWNS